MRFARENDFDDIVATAGRAWDVEPALIKAIIAAESGFNIHAFRAEPHINDASYGLMQILYGTAKAIGFTGKPHELYDPTTNIRLGTRYLADNIRTALARGFKVDSAISAYNAGFSAVRRGDGKRVTNDPGSPFINQAYVNKILELASYFKHSVHQLAPVVVNARPVVTDNASMWPLWFAAFPLLLILAKRRR